jgi:hypothetical protein
MSCSCPNPVERRFDIIGMKCDIIIRVLLPRLGLDTKKFLDYIQTAEYRMMVEIRERWIRPLSSPGTGHFIQYNGSLSRSVQSSEKSIVSVILRLLAV